MPSPFPVFPRTKQAHAILWVASTHTMQCLATDVQIVLAHACNLVITSLFQHGEHVCPFTTIGTYSSSCRFPLSYSLPHIPTPATTNHSSALHMITTSSLSSHVLCFTPQFQVNPVMTAPKKHSDTRRLTLDLSFPPLAAVDILAFPKTPWLSIKNSAPMCKGSMWPYSSKTGVSPLELSLFNDDTCPSGQIRYPSHL